MRDPKKSLVATYTYDALSLADVLVVDVQCDFLKEELGNLRSGFADISALEESFKIIGEKISPDCLVLIETTVPPGTTEYVAYPLIKRAFRKRGLDQEPFELRSDFKLHGAPKRRGQRSYPQISRITQIKIQRKKS